MVQEEEWMKFDGNNWETMLYFLKGRGSLIKEYEYRSSGEIITYIHIPDLGVNVVVGEVCVYINDDLVVFNEEEWKLFNTPECILEFERLLNIIMNVVKPEISIMSIIEDITEGSLVIEYDGFDAIANGNFNFDVTQYTINGYICQITKEDGKFKVIVK